MGNSLYQGETKFSIKPLYEGLLVNTLRLEAQEVLEHEGRRAGDIREVTEEEGLSVEQLTLDNLFACWGWSLIREIADETDEIVDIELWEDFSSTEEEFFKLIAPFIAPGSYITLSGNQRGEEWVTRYGFTGKRIVELEAAYPEVPIEK